MKTSRLCRSALKLAHIWHYSVYGEHPKRRLIAMDILRHRLRLAIHRMTGGPIESISILGREMYFQSPSTLDILLAEVFINEGYRSSQNSPEKILDCGSNIGMSIMYFKSMWPHAQVIGVEASPETFKLLHRNIADLPGVALLNIAVSDQRRSIPFYSSSSNSLVGSTNPIRGGGEAIFVDAVPISELVDGPIDLLKIDIEGSEIAAFSDLEMSGKMSLIREMLIEYHHHLSEQTSSLPDFLERLSRCGFDYEIAAEMPRAPGDFQDVLIRATRI